ncbi:uncharacterized protein RSE6_01521 [Rhynchosporium secalis]|uniref:Uncharacterized protein n=1 Tax=Rhynchosporium secalis TaxID=38038 RepID=A0A1E1LY01_RHYSE|nr:uncharacterized protein RSE6_01521 [Rhynchosporium secalis]
MRFISVFLLGLSSLTVTLAKEGLELDPCKKPLDCKSGICAQGDTKQVCMASGKKDEQCLRLKPDSCNSGLKCVAPRGIAIGICNPA